MARTKVMKLWTAIVTAFLALCTALGLITTNASAAVPQSAPTRNSELTTPATSPRSSGSGARALPPTMKQRILAEAHGTSPRCRHRLLADTAGDTTAPAAPDEPESPAPPLARLQR
ncbi:DUF6344 domain-containing protein [Streptomyces sp. NPDC052682]|uniref:DUF6344 domain-containing protein n=1 Tax=Streptomyces sp. NPDC052682 TaxID=3154954 RepID=UPI00342D0331